MPKPKKITDQFRELFAECGKTQKEVCDATGIDRATISRFLSGERFLSPHTFDTLAAYLGWEAHATATKTKGSRSNTGN